MIKVNKLINLIEQKGINEIMNEINGILNIVEEEKYLDNVVIKCLKKISNLKNENAKIILIDHLLDNALNKLNQKKTKYKKKEKYKNFTIYEYDLFCDIYVEKYDENIIQYLKKKNITDVYIIDKETKRKINIDTFKKTKNEEHTKLRYEKKSIVTTAHNELNRDLPLDCN